MSKQLLSSVCAASKRGYTLVELMVVVAIVGILATLSTPTVMQARRRASARQSASDLANVFRNARTQAMTRGEVVLVTINPNHDDNMVRMHAAPHSIPSDPDSPVVRSCRSGRLIGNLASALSEDRIPDVAYGKDASTLAAQESARQILHPSISMSTGGALGLVMSGTGGQPDTLCFAPDGRIFNAYSGLPVGVDLGACSRGFTMAIGTMTVAQDLTAYSTDGLVGTANVLCPGKTSGFSHKIWRSNDYIYVIELTHNGSIVVEG